MKGCLIHERMICRFDMVIRWILYLGYIIDHLIEIQAGNAPQAALNAIH